MRRRLQDHTRKQRGDTKAKAQPLDTARVVQLAPEKDYGFIETADGRQIYFHRNSVLHGHFDQLRAGSAVRYAEEMGEKGPQATTVRLAHPRKEAKSAALTVPVPPRRVSEERRKDS
jgi:cold shock CspA family protein